MGVSTIGGARMLERERTAKLICSELNNFVDLKGTLRTIVKHLQSLTGCAAVGVRLRDGDDYPYYVQDGFPEAFVLKENSLCAVDGGRRIPAPDGDGYLLECMCGNIIQGRFDPALPFCAPTGSFWTNSATALLASTNEKDRQCRTRNHCAACGYESVALAPLKANGKRIGLVQLNDKRTGRFDQELIEYVEMIGEQVGAAVQNSLTFTRLKEKEELNRALFEYSPIQTVVVDRGGRITMFNWAKRSSGGKLPRVGDLMYKDYAGRHGRDMRAELLQCIASGQIKEFPELKYDDNYLSITISPFVHGAIITAKDITSHKKVEEALKEAYGKLEFAHEELLATRRSERLAFTGRIAASIAHEIRNPSTNVSLALHQLSLTFEPRGSQAEYVEIIEKNINRINCLITELLNCARPPELNMRQHNLHELLEEVVESVSTQIHAQKLDVSLDFAPGPAIVKMDRKHMERALLNLVLNAIEAMPKKGGHLSVTTERDPKCFRVKIADNGKGIPEEDIIKIFDPFFSSKPGGVGLGLTTCYGVIVSHGGTIEVESKPSKGSLFTVVLPI